MAFGAGCAVLPGQAGPALLLCGEMMCFTHHMRPVFPCPRSSTPPALACLARLWSSARTLSTPSWRGGTPTPPTSSWRRWGGWGWGKQPEGAPHPQKAETAGGGSPPSLGGWKQPSLVPVRGEWDVQGDCPCTLQLRGAAAWWTAGCHGCEGSIAAEAELLCCIRCLTDPQGAAAQQALVSRAQQYMIRRTSETLKQYLPAKVQEVRPTCTCCTPTHNAHLGWRILCFGKQSNLTHVYIESQQTARPAFLARWVWAQGPRLDPPRRSSSAACRRCSTRSTRASWPARR